jgi:hypothetical protein
MDIVLLISSIPIFILLLFPLIWIRDVRFTIIWTLLDLLITWLLGSLINSCAIEQWNTLATSFAVYPFFEALKVATISVLSLVGIGALLFILYFLSVCFIFVLIDLEPEDRPIYQARNEAPQIPFYYRMREHERTRLTPVPEEVIRRLVEGD